MDDFEQQLKRAMARKEPPRFLRSKGARGGSQGLRAPAELVGMAGPAGGAPVGNGGAGSGTGYDRSHLAARTGATAGEQARAKLELALKITSEKLQRIDREIVSLQNGE